MKKWINGARARAFLGCKDIAILNREARISYGKAPIRIRAISGGWVRNTRRVRKILIKAREEWKTWKKKYWNPRIASIN
jgi:hypothetical protein